MKKAIFIVLLILTCLILIGALGLTGYGVYNFALDYNAYSKLYTASSQSLCQGNSFANSYDRTSSVILERDLYADEYDYIYEKDNIFFLSDSDSWTEKELSLLADELYSNKHGDEIHYLRTVILNAENNTEYAGTHEEIQETFLIPAYIFNFLPSATIKQEYEMSQISLYDADNKNTIEQMAIVLSHEYGHHFTFFHFRLKFSTADRATDYYKMRAADIDEILLSVQTMDEYIENHMWYLCEIAAEDYVYLMGSETVRQALEFYDGDDILEMYINANGEIAEDETFESETIDIPCRNAVPHENVALLLPDQVEGLEEYFYSFIDEDPPERSEKISAGTLNLKMSRTGTFNHTFTWDQPYTDEGVIYTLIIYDRQDNVKYIVKTTYSDEEGTASFGFYNYLFETDSGTKVYPIGWNITRNTRLRARVSVTFPDGTVLMSDPYNFVY